MKVSTLGKISSAIASLVAFSTAYSAMDMDSRVTQLENQMQQVRTETPMGTYGAQTATARADVDGQGWFITFDVLYWHAKVGGTEFAYSDQDPRGKLPVKGRTKDIDFDWDWGLRFGLGYNFDHDGWDLKGQYTWFDTNGHTSTQAGANSSIIPLLGSSTIVKSAATSTDNQFVYCLNAKSQYDFDYNSVDIELGRAYFVSKKLSFRPHFGVRSSWVDQEQITRYTGGLVDSSEPTQLGLEGNTIHIKDDCDFWGIGPRAGLESKWHLGCGFSIFGNIAGSLLFGFFDIEHKERYSQFEANQIKLTANRHAFSPTAQMQVGLRYDKYLNNNKHHIGIGFGFEAQYLWRQNQMLKIDDSQALKYERRSEDVSMHGLTLDITWDF